MSLNGKSTIPEILKKYQDELLTDWLKELSAAGIRRELLPHSRVYIYSAPTVWGCGKGGGIDS